jgi:hypothetical protein
VQRNLRHHGQHFLRYLILLVAFCLSPATGKGQQKRDSDEPQKKLSSYGFVSPNTRENLTLREAISGLDSREENKLIDQIRATTCRLRVRVRIVKALGSWADGAEQTILFRMRADEPAVRYALSSLGKSARQKAALYFQRNNSGNSRLYILAPRFPQSASAISRKLDQLGIAYRTLVPLKNRKLVYIVDLKNELQEKIWPAARALRAKVTSFNGSGNFIGDDSDRERGQQVFEQEIKAYEETHSLRKCLKGEQNKLKSVLRLPFGILVDSSRPFGLGAFA